MKNLTTVFAYIRLIADARNGHFTKSVRFLPPLRCNQGFEIARKFGWRFVNNPILHGHFWFPKYTGGGFFVPAVFNPKIIKLPIRIFENR